MKLQLCNPLTQSEGKVAALHISYLDNSSRCHRFHGYHTCYFASSKGDTWATVRFDARLVPTSTLEGGQVPKSGSGRLSNAMQKQMQVV
jgi:hypothetical protein